MVCLEPFPIAEGVVYVKFSKSGLGKSWKKV
jgi:hypothetical protein